MNRQIVEGMLMDSNKNILDAYTMATELGVGRNFIYRELKAGRIPATKIGDRYFLSRSAWEQYLSGQKQAAKTN